MAVLAVFADHALGAPSGGFVGVDIFFVISGFLITGLLMREHERDGRISLVGFYKRRLRRLAPASVVTIAITVAASYLLFFTPRADQIRADGIWAFFAASNWGFISQRTDYFSQDSPVSPLQHFWSLSVEEQFYLVWPVLILLVMIGCLRWGVTRPRKVLAGVLGMIIVVSFTVGYIWPFTMPSVDYFNTITRVWELGVGALLAVTWPMLPMLSRQVRLLTASMGMAMVTAALLFIDDDMSFPVPWAVIPILGTALVIAAGTGDARHPLPFLEGRILVYIGDISYSLYLWHFPALVLGAVIFSQFGGWALPASIAVGFLMGVISYHLIERPVLVSPWLARGGEWTSWWRQNRRAILRLGLTAVLLIGLTTSVGLAQVISSRPATSPREGASLSALLAKATSNPTLTSEALSSLNKPADIPWPLGAGTPCLNRPQETALEKCRAGKGENTALVIGDSYAAATYPALVSALGSNGYQAVGMMNSSCAVMTAPMKWLTRPDYQTACNARNADLAEIVKEAQAELVVVLDSEVGYAAVDSAGDLGADYARGRVEALRDIAKVAKVVVVEANPKGSSAQQCLNRLSMSASSCLTHPSEQWRAKTSIDRDIARKLGISYVSTLDLYCANWTCPISVGDLMQRFDDGHLTAAYDQLIAPAMSQRISSALAPMHE